MKGWLLRIRVRLAEKNMVVNRDKELLYGRSKSCLQVWTEAPPDYEGRLAQQVRDLGARVRAYACKNHLVDAKLEVLKIIAARAIWRDRAVRNRQVMLLLMESGKWEPEVATAKG